jgi:hypothetical protein
VAIGELPEEGLHGEDTEDVRGYDYSQYNNEVNWLKDRPARLDQHESGIWKAL